MNCYGRGVEQCYRCGGDGKLRCHMCEGNGLLRWFILLTVRWTNYRQDHVLERTALPNDLIQYAGGEVPFTETELRVWPVNHCPEMEINMVSSQLVLQSHVMYPTHKTLMQRQQVRVVPVTMVRYTYKEKQRVYWIYGLERKVYCPDYPAKCCFGCCGLCNIM